ncbi:MAG: UDP-N-acetylmuramate--L-alanine ligase [Ignavibacteriota bacterium]
MTVKKEIMYLNKKVKSVHFIGIGGIGMCGLAEYLLIKGYKVTGSDSTKTFITERLEKKGAKVTYSHSADNISKGVHLVVYTSAVKKDNPEYKKALALKINTIKRAVLLGELVNGLNLIAVSGTHGKTSTTSMIANILIKSGIDPTVFVGGNLDVLGGASYRIGKGKWAVVEADEYDRSFLTLKPNIIVVNNIELDHIDIYKNEKSLKTAFRSFLSNLKEEGTIVANYDDKNVRELVDPVDEVVIDFGIKGTNVISNVKMSAAKTTFSLNDFKVELGIPGYHNVYNASAAICATIFAAKSANIFRSLKDFKGVNRRLELKYDKINLEVYDDYGHHPSEVLSSLKSLKDIDRKRLIVVFQPHTYSRTKQFYKEFAKSLSVADKVYLLPVYAAREKAMKGVSSKLIYNLIKKDKCLVENENNLYADLRKSLRKGDRVVFQGAGDVTNMCDKFIKGIKTK